MSMGSAIYADYAESVRLEWVARLEAALNDEDFDIDAVRGLLQDMKNFYFSE